MSTPPSASIIPTRPSPMRLGAWSDESIGMLFALIAVAMFSLTLPFTRMAVAELDPLFVSMGRAVAAALMAGVWLRISGAPMPPRTAWLSLAGVALGCVIGFPMLTSIALRSLPASHGAILIGVLPLATAMYSALRGNEQPSLGFWAFALLGSGLVIGFALRQSGGSFHPADLLMFGAVVLAAIGYAEGGRLSASMGGIRVICWALLLALPFSLPATIGSAWLHLDQLAAAGPRAWTGFAYVSAISMFIGFFFWYRAMSLAGIARAGQVQLLQPFLTLVGAALMLGEQLEAAHFLFAVAVIAVVWAGRRMQVKRPVVQ